MSCRHERAQEACERNMETYATRRDMSQDKMDKQNDDTRSKNEELKNLQLLGRGSIGP